MSWATDYDGTVGDWRGDGIFADSKPELNDLRRSRRRTRPRLPLLTQAEKELAADFPWAFEDPPPAPAVLTTPPYAGAKPCECGCGGYPRGRQVGIPSRWLPGHNLKRR